MTLIYLRLLNCICLKKFHGQIKSYYINNMLNFWEKDFERTIEEHIDFLKKNLEYQE